MPRFNYVIGLEEDVPTGMAVLATEVGRVGEQFDALSRIFQESPESTYTSDTVFINGQLTFVFQVPRRWVPRLRELGWEPADLDVQPEGTVPNESDISDA